MKSSISIPISKMSIFDDLTPNEGIELLFAIRDTYMGKQPKISGSVRIAYMVFKDDIEKDIEKHEKMVERNKNNGKKHEAKITQENPQQPTGFLQLSENEDEQKNTIKIFKPKKEKNKTESWQNITFEKLSVKEVGGKNRVEIDLDASGFPFGSINKQYADVTFKFYLLFHHTYESINITPTVLKKAKFYSWYLQMKDLLENKGATLEKLREVWSFLYRDDITKQFAWRKVIRSISNLSEHYPTLCIEAFSVNNRQEKKTIGEETARAEQDARRLYRLRNGLQPTNSNSANEQQKQLQ